MNDSELNYLRAINQQLAGPISESIGDGMAGRMLYCVNHLLSSLVAERLVDGAAALAENTDAVEQDRLRWLAIEERYSQLSQPNPAGGDREVAPLDEGERSRLLHLLRETCGEGPQLRIEGVRAIAGGFSKQTIMVSLAGNSQLPTDIVVRRDRAESPVGSTVLDEFDLLALLHRKGLQVPRPLAVDAKEVMGCPILVMEKAEGSNIGDVYNIHAPASVSPTLANNLAAELAKLHAIPLAELPANTQGLNSSHKDFLRAEMQGFQNNWQQLGESSATIDSAFCWLFAHVDRLGEQQCLAHRDSRFHNILSQGEQLSALLDWELACVSHPARDLGYSYHHVIQFADWQAFLAAYADAGGQVPSALEIDFYVLWSDLFVAIYMYLARASYLAGDGANIQLAYAGERLRQHNMYLLAQRLLEIKGRHP